MPSITVTIDQYGQPTIATKGFSGSACKTATKSLEDALLGSGADKVVRKNTPEFFQQTATPNKVTLKGSK